MTRFDCSFCGTTPTFAEYATWRVSKDGTKALCPPCATEIVREANKERARRREQSWRPATALDEGGENSYGNSGGGYRRRDRVLEEATEEERFKRAIASLPSYAQVQPSRVRRRRG